MHPVRVEGLGERPSRREMGNALVYDLSPWDRGATASLRAYTTRVGAPVLLYLPPTGSAFAALSGVEQRDGMELQVQCRDQESLQHLREAARRLVAAIPRVRVMDCLAHCLPNISSAAFLFAHRTLAILASGRRPTVTAIARGLGLSARTLQRHFARENLPCPKALLDTLTLAHVHAVAGCRHVSVAQAAAESGMNDNDLYRLRKRVSRAARTPAGLVDLCPAEGARLPAPISRLRWHLGGSWTDIARCR